MWQLLKGQLARWWYRPAIVAIAVFAVVATWEMIRRGHGWHELRAVYPWMIFAGMVVAGAFSQFECREHRMVLFKSLPVTTSAVGWAKALVPAALFLSANLVAFAAAWALGAVGAEARFSVRLLSFAALLLAIQQAEIFWGELKPLFTRWRYGRLTHFAVPLLIGAAVGGVFGFRVASGDDKAQVLAQIYALFDLKTLWLSVAVAALAAVSSVFVFSRREQFLRQGA